MARPWSLRQRFFVLLRCRPGQSYRVAEEIARQKRSTYSEMHSITGEWDLLLRVEYDSKRDFGATIAELLRDIPDIERTHTILAYPIWDPEDIYF